MDNGASDAATLERVADNVEQAARDQQQVAGAARRIAGRRRRGQSWRTITESGTPQLIVNRLASTWKQLRSDAGAVRALAARGLTEEGAAIRHVGRVFDVSHQRIASILARHREAATEGEA